MSATGFSIPKYGGQSRGKDAGQALLFILPSIVITVISIALFAQLGGFTAEQHNLFSLIIMAAVIFSLVGTAWMQVLIYRMADDQRYSREGGVLRGIRIGILYSVLFSIVLAGILSVYFARGLYFTPIDILYFLLLLVMYSIIWVITAGFWASGEYRQPAIVFTVSYLALFGLTYLAHRINPAYTITGYTVGVVLLMVLSWAASRRTFRYPLGTPALRDDVPSLMRLASRNTAAIMFNLLYVLALFLDKIIVWISQGILSGQGILVTGPYTAGAFLGLIPIFSVAAIAYFSNRTRRLVEDRYQGTLLEIDRHAREYKHLYWSSFGAMLGIAIGILLLVAALANRFVGDGQIMKIMLTTSVGALFFLGIIHNSVVLPLFGKTHISMFAILAVCLGELASIPLVGIDVWYASVGFLVGSFVGFLISFINTTRLLSEFEYNIFRYVASAT